MSRSAFSLVTSRRSRSISNCSGFICPWPGKACTGLEPNSFTHLRSTFSWTPRSRPACATDTPRSLTSLTASTLNSRLNFRLCMTYLRLYETPNLGVHQTGSSSVGLNFLIAGYVYAQGKLAFDPNLSIADTNFHSNTGLLAYVRSFDFAGQSAKFDVIVPGASFDAKGLVDGLPRERQMAGLGDPRFRFSFNLFGAPALSAKDFASYQQDLIVGVSLQFSAPLGQYDDSKLLNLGNNRWSFKPELGISKAWGPWTFELAPSVTFFSNNTDFVGGNTFAQAPFYAVQGHILYTFQSGAWFALDGVYFSGGRISLNGVKSDNEQRNSRAGFTV